MQEPAKFYYHEYVSTKPKALRSRQFQSVFVVAALLFLAGAAHADDVDWAQKNAQACNDTLGYVGCANLGRPQGPPPGIWGAIAFSTSTFSSGYSWGQQNVQSAANAAASECYRAMNAMRDCPIVGSFANACAALATSGKEAAWGYSGPYNSVRDAAQNAMDRCQKGGGRSCTIVASVCSPGGTANAPDVFVAIAISAQPLAWGISWQANSRAEANSTAITYCQKSGGQQCKVQMLAWNTCVALATSEDGAWAVDRNDSKSVANSKVLQTCRTDKGTNCTVKASTCATDPR